MRVNYIEVRGFRSFGSQAQRLDFDSPLVVVAADNSQGKTSLAEALEFLFTGATTRRLLLGGSPSEFEDALRNVHLGAREAVYVEAEITKDDGTSAVLRRDLVADYRGASDCTSRLSIDGNTAHSVTEAGVPLSDPPLAAPVLLEHTMRYAVSAKPGERSDYFKALLEVADLDVVKREIGALITEQESAPRSRVLTLLGQLAALPLFSQVVAPIRSASSQEQVEQSLVNASHAAVPPETPNVEHLSVAADRVRNALEARQLNVLPVGDLDSASPTPFTIAAPDSAVDQAFAESLAEFEATVADYRDRVAAVDTATAEVIPLLQSALQTSPITSVDADHPIGCPLCLTPAAITAERVDAIRAELADRQQLGTAAGLVRTRAQAISTALDGLSRSCARAVPPALAWTPDVRSQHDETARRLGAEPGELQRQLTAVDDVQILAARVRERATAAQGLLDTLGTLAARMSDITTDELEICLAHLRLVNDDATQFATVHAQMTTGLAAFQDLVRPALEAGTDTAGWSVLLELAAQPGAIVDALRQFRRRASTLQRLRQAASDFDTASTRVLDQRLTAMGDEVARWWNLLRPDELTTFDAITRKGAGKRYLDVTAVLAPQATAPGVVRNALAVFSNSQLNALGLSAFLARCTLLNSPVVLLDDPVPGSDREHRSTFASNVVEALLSDGRQVVVTTHDSELARHLHTVHQHLGVADFQAVLTDPREGTQVLRAGDDFEQLMLDAQSQMHSPLVNNRRAAGNALRIAAERLAKHVIVAGRRRAGDPAAAISDYDNKNLKDLRPLASAYVVRDNEPGQWTMVARILNDADHDTLDPPLPADLKQCHASLRQLKRQHLSNDPHLTQL